MVRLSVFLIISLIVTVCYFVGLAKFLTDVGDDKCEMTYMYEYPQFIRVTNDIDQKYPKYGLYAYGEGRLTAKVRNMRFDGIPVLFIPGNAGSHKQVRSLSSVALRKALDDNTPFHFDYFTVDLNDEFSGLYGPLLYDQLDYVNHSFYRIFSLYKGRYQPNSIILVGHSMGGIIAKKLLTQLEPQTNLVPILITLASPLKRAPLILDYHMQSFYESLTSNTDSNSATTIVSLSGGYKDFLIPTFLTKVNNKSNINVVTSNVPMAWIENNHVQVLWCKQLILALSRALFDTVDPKTNFITTNSTYRSIVFNHHLNHHSGIRIKNLPYYSELLKLDFKGKWIESLYKQYTVEHLKGVKEPHWYMVKLTTLPGHDIVNILALNLEIINWVYACNANHQKGPSRVCGEAHQLTHLSEIAPSIKYKRRFIQLNLREVYRKNPELTHVVFRTLPTNEPLVFHVDIHSDSERIVETDLPKWWSRKREIVIANTPQKALNLKISLPNLQNVIQYYQLYVEPHSCKKNNHHASVTLVTPWAEEDRHAFFTSTEKKPFDLRLYSSQPKNFSGDPFLKFILDPSCTYEISIKPSLTGSLGQLARYYTPLLLTNVAVVILLALKYQLLRFKDGYWPIIFTALTRGPRAYYILTFARILAHPIKALPKNFANFIPVPDIWYVIDAGLDFMIIPFFLYFCSVGIVFSLSVLYGISLFTLESTANKVALKLLTRAFIWSNYFMTFLHKVPVIVAAILVFLSITTCGGLALCLGTVFYFLRLTQMSQDYVEDVCWFVVKKCGWKFFNVFLKRRRVGYENMSSENRSNKFINTNTNIDPPLRTKSETNKDKSKAQEFTDTIHDKTINTVENSEGSTKKLDDKSTNTVEGNETDNNSKSKKSTNTKRDKCINTVDNVEKNEGSQSCNKNKGKDDEDNENSSSDIAKSNDDNIENQINQDQESNDLESPADESTAPVISNIHDEVPEDGTQEEQNTHIPREYNTIFFHTTIFFLWCIVTLINIPAVLTWAHNFNFYKFLSPDDSFIPGIILSLCAGPLWHFDFPRENKKWQEALGMIITNVVLFCLMFATVSLYRLNYLLTFVIAIITLHQLFAPKIVFSEVDVDRDGKMDDKDVLKEKYEDVKKKID